MTRFLLLLAVAGAAMADPRGSSGRIDRVLTTHYKHPQDPAPMIELAANYVVKYGDEAKFADRDEAVKYLNLAKGVAPQDPGILLWTGALKCVEARDKSSKAVAREGLDLMDKAVEKAPKNLDFRLIRASVGLEAPHDFNRVDQAVGDLELIEQAAKVDPASAKTYDIDMAEVWLKLGEGYKSKGNLDGARAKWELAVKDSPNSTDGKKAARLLRKYPPPR